MVMDEYKFRLKITSIIKINVEQPSFMMQKRNLNLYDKNLFGMNLALQFS